MVLQNCSLIKLGCWLSHFPLIIQNQKNQQKTKHEKYIKINRIEHYDLTFGVDTLDIVTRRLTHNQINMSSVKYILWKKSLKFLTNVGMQMNILAGFSLHLKIYILINPHFIHYLMINI